MRKKVVISAINIIDGGALTVLKQVMDTITKDKFSAYDFYILLSNKNVLTKNVRPCHKNINFMYFPMSKKSWIIRLFYEYIYFLFLSLSLKPDVWFSLHDVTPNVICKKRFVYCHNPSIFIKFPLRDFLKDKKQFFFCLLYKFFYRINIKKNYNVIVQQHWIAQEFEKLFDISNVIVAQPISSSKSEPKTIASAIFLDNVQECSVRDQKIIFYPAFPRYFKNHKILLNAGQCIADKAKIILTLTPDENGFIRSLIAESSNVDLKGLEFVGRLNREQVEYYYSLSDALVFPSLMETWGLPITEYKNYGKPIFAADMPYAHETVGDYGNVYWFDPLDKNSLVKAIDKWLLGKGPDVSKNISTNFPALKSWDELMEFILK